MNGEIQMNSFVFQAIWNMLFCILKKMVMTFDPQTEHEC